MKANKKIGLLSIIGLAGLLSLTACAENLGSSSSSNSLPGGSSSDSTLSDSSTNPPSSDSSSGGGTIEPEKTFEEYAIESYEKYYDSLSESKFAYYTRDDEYMVFESKEDYQYLGVWERETNTFSDDASEKFVFTLTNQGHRILMHKENGLSNNSVQLEEGIPFAWEDDYLYTLITDDGISNLVSANNYHPYFFYETINNEGLQETSIAAKKGDSLKNLYTANYEEILPESILNAIYDVPAILTIPSAVNNISIDSIGSFKNQNITSLTIQEGIKKVLVEAFENTNLTSITFPNSMLEVQDNAFRSCASLTELYIPSKLTNFSSSALTDSTVNKLIFDSKMSASYHAFPNLSSYEIIEFLNVDTYNTIKEAFKYGDVVNINKVITSAIESGKKVHNISLTEISANQKLIVPIDNDDFPEIRQFNTYYGTITESDGTKVDTKYLDRSNDPNYIALQINLGTDLSLFGTMELAGMVNTQNQAFQGQITGYYTVLDLQGNTLTIENGGVLNCNGKIIDSAGGGQIIVKNGGTISSNFVVEDFMGGSISYGRYAGNVSPFNKYRMNYIEPKTIIEYGAQYLGECVLYASSKHNKTEQIIIGQGGLLEIEDEDSYVVKEVNVETKRETFDLYGNIKTNSMSIDVGMQVGTEKVFFPLPRNYTINAVEGRFTVNTKMKILPGAEVNIKENATVVINNQIIIYDEIYDYTTETDKAHHVCSNVNHFNPYVNKAADPDCLDVEPAAKVVIDGNVEFYHGEKENVQGLAGNVIINSEEKLSELTTIFASNNLTRVLTSKEGSAKGSSIFASFVLCYEMTRPLQLVLNNQIRVQFSDYAYYEYQYEETELLSLTMKALDGTKVAMYDSINGWNIVFNGENVKVEKEDLNMTNAISKGEDSAYILLDNRWILATINKDGLYEEASTGKLYVKLGDSYVLVNYNDGNIYESTPDGEYSFIVANNEENNPIKGTFNEEKVIFEGDNNKDYIWINQAWNAGSYMTSNQYFTLSNEQKTVCILLENQWIALTSFDTNCFVGELVKEDQSKVYYFYTDGLWQIANQYSFDSTRKILTIDNEKSYIRLNYQYVEGYPIKEVKSLLFVLKSDNTIYLYDTAYSTWYNATIDGVNKFEPVSETVYSIQRGNYDCIFVETETDFTVVNKRTGGIVFTETGAVIEDTYAGVTYKYSHSELVQVFDFIETETMMMEIQIFQLKAIEINVNDTVISDGTYDTLSKVYTTKNGEQYLYYTVDSKKAWRSLATFENGQYVLENDTKIFAYSATTTSINWTAESKYYKVDAVNGIMNYVTTSSKRTYILIKGEINVYYQAKLVAGSTTQYQVESPAYKDKIFSFNAETGFFEEVVNSEVA